MKTQIYFSPEDLRQRRRGKSYAIDNPIIGGDGRSYELGEWIARGGNATVFRCKERSSGNELAIKFLMLPGRRIAERFSREGELLAKLSHNHIVKYRTAGKVRPHSDRRRVIPFIIMEIAERNLLTEMQESECSIPTEVFLGQFRGLAQGLELLHQHAVHRDIKPENILVSGDRWLLSDYGLCKFAGSRGPDLTPEDQAPGPKFWMSPEGQNRRLGVGDAICKASDVYQLAAVFWFIATARHPSGIISRLDWTGPDRLFRPLYDALQHDYKRRPQDGAAFLAALEDALMT